MKAVSAVDAELEAVLDPWIKPLVLFLREYGFQTFASCDGGTGHAFSFPTVRLWKSPGRSLEATRKELVHVLRRRKIEVGFSTSCHYQHGGGLPSQAFVQIEFWGTSALPRFEDPQ